MSENMCYCHCIREAILMQFNDGDSDKHSWNKRQNKNNWSLYILVGSICVILGWLLGGVE